MVGISVLAIPLFEDEYHELEKYWYIKVGYNGEVFNTKTNKYLKKSVDKYGYERVFIGEKSYLVHRLVALIYVRRIDKSNKLVCHKNKNRRDNRAINLMWTNNNFINIRRSGFDMPNRGKKIVAFKNGIPFKTFDNGGQAEKELKVNRSEVYRCCKGQRKTTGGYGFKYYLDYILEFLLEG